jgi:membrane protease YdiL (CAAX protease family)
MSGVVGGLVALLVFTALVDWLRWVPIDFHGKTTTTISPDGKILALSVVFTVNLVLAVLAWRLFERRPLADMLWKFSREQWRPLACGLLAGAAEIILVFGCLTALGAARVAWGLRAVPPKTIAMALGWVFVSCIMGPVLEEVLTRGYWFQNIRRGWGILPATVVNALLFGSLHLFNPNAKLLGAVNIALIAVLFVLGMLWFRSLWFPIGWHAAWNFGQFFVVGLPNSGISVSSLGLNGTTLLASEVSGPLWLTGGGFGMEGSVVQTIVLTGAIVLALWWTQSRARSQATY